MDPQRIPATSVSEEGASIAIAEQRQGILALMAVEVVRWFLLAVLVLEMKLNSVARNLNCGLDNAIALS